MKLTQHLILLMGLAGFPAIAQKDVKGAAAHQRVIQRMHHDGDEIEARNDAADLANARLQADIDKLQGQPVDRDRLSEAATKVEADRKKGLHPEKFISEAGCASNARCKLDVKIAHLRQMQADLDALVANLDCSAAIIEKHNREFPSEPWGVSNETRDALAGPPAGKRLRNAIACAESGGMPQTEQTGRAGRSQGQSAVSERESHRP